MKLRHTVLAGLAGIFFTANANATTFFIDELQITKNGDTNWFVDPFDDGNPPPSSESVFPNGQPASYLTLPDPLPGPEQNSRVELDSAKGALQNSFVTGEEILFQRARVLTNRSNDPADNRGLKVNHTFEVRGLFDLIEPQYQLEAYGIRLADFGSTPETNDIVGLQVVRSRSDQWRVAFFDAGIGVFNVLDSFLLPSVAQLDQYEQIALMLTKGDVASNAITASFELIDTDGALASIAVAMAGSGNLFDGERWTRAGFFARGVVPVPATLALIGLGLIGLGCRQRRQVRAV